MAAFGEHAISTIALFYSCFTLLNNKDIMTLITRSPNAIYVL